MAMRFQALKAGDWKEFVKARADGICAGLRQALTDLQGDFSISCDQCGAPAVVPIGLQEVVTLLKTDGVLQYTCPNPACLDKEPGLRGVFGSTRPHDLPPITLEDLAIAYFGRYVPPDSAINL